MFETCRPPLFSLIKWHNSFEITALSYFLPLLTKFSFVCFLLCYFFSSACRPQRSYLIIFVIAIFYLLMPNFNFFYFLPKNNLLNRLIFGIKDPGHIVWLVFFLSFLNYSCQISIIHSQKFHGLGGYIFWPRRLIFCMRDPWSITPWHFCIIFKKDWNCKHGIFREEWI